MSLGKRLRVLEILDKIGGVKVDKNIYVKSAI